jgi:hypothetical protein
MYIQIALQQIPAGSGLQTTEMTQKDILVFLCDYRCKGEEIHGAAVSIDAYPVSEKHE